MVPVQPTLGAGLSADAELVSVPAMKQEGQPEANGQLRHEGGRTLFTGCRPALGGSDT